MEDIVDNHRVNVRKAGETLAAAIKAADEVYAKALDAARSEHIAAIAASEIALDLLMEKRIDAFKGKKPSETSQTRSQDNTSPKDETFADSNGRLSDLAEREAAFKASGVPAFLTRPGDAPKQDAA